MPKICFCHKKEDDISRNFAISFQNGAQQENDHGGNGKTILTTMSASDLAREVHELQKLLRKKDQELKRGNYYINVNSKAIPQSEDKSEQGKLYLLLKDLREFMKWEERLGLYLNIPRWTLQR